MPGDFKGTVFQKNQVGVKIFCIFKTKTALCVYRDYAKRRNIYLKGEYLSLKKYEF
jgi:hypothetical protein